MENIPAATTDRTILVFIPDPASTDGSGKTGLTHETITVSYTRVETDNDVVLVDVTSSLTTLSALTDAHADWGLKEVDSTLAPGLYRLDVADAVFATGAWYAAVYVMITSSAAAATPKAFNLVTPAANVTQWNSTAVATPATAGHPVVTLKVGTGTGELNLSSGKAPATVAAGDLATDSITADALKADALSEIADAICDEALTGHVTNGTVGMALSLLQADRYIDTNVTPWALVYMKRGTGGIGVGTELLRQDITDTDGANVTATTDVVGNLVE